jgi:hypothetical protein
VCQGLMKAAINRHYYVFATTRVANACMMQLLNKEFEPYGITYQSSRGDYLLHAFIKKGSMWIRPLNIIEWVSGNPNCWREVVASDTRRDKVIMKTTRG